MGIKKWKKTASCKDCRYLKMDVFGRTPVHVACIVGDADRLDHHLAAAHHLLDGLCIIYFPFQLIHFNHFNTFNH
jgi:hypothetical protein